MICLHVNNKRKINNFPTLIYKIDNQPNVSNPISPKQNKYNKTFFFFLHNKPSQQYKLLCNVLLRRWNTSQEAEPSWLVRNKNTNHGDDVLLNHFFCRHHLSATLQISSHVVKCNVYRSAWPQSRVMMMAWNKILCILMKNVVVNNKAQAQFCCYFVLPITNWRLCCSQPKRWKMGRVNLKNIYKDKHSIVLWFCFLSPSFA